MEVGLQPHTVAEALLAILIVSCLVVPSAWAAPIAVGLSIVLAQFGLVAPDLIAVVAVVLLAGFREFRFSYRAAGVAVGYLAVLMGFPGHYGVFLDAGVILAAATVSAAVQIVAGTQGRRIIQQTESSCADPRLSPNPEGSFSVDRLAVQIHDSIGRYLAAIQAVGNGAAASQDQEVKRLAAEKIQFLVSQAQLCTRELIQRLKSPEDEPAACSLEELPRLIYQAVPVQVRSSVSIIGKPSSWVEESIVSRTVLEAVTNALRHAEGMRVLEVSVLFGASDIDIQVGNDGGLVSHPQRLGGLGRLETELSRLGGRVDFGPKPEGGWRVLARLPRHHH